ncbi:sensor histidine kinase [Thalassotalea piscium]|uniref:histidine kinase n=1 Tax=Thalassotalea piscium TaxID=1230533 RepID=A0A7X0NK67_9GAMM|nr:ATP-binding protein [Thalassotalea piscium]MBB6544916.1 signal transduction histidine kinase [Thalassotalea piscium]
MPNTGSFNNKLSRRVLIYILLCSSILSLTSTAIQLYAAYQDGLSALDQQFDNIETSYSQPLSTSLWDFNEPLVVQQLEGIVRLPGIHFAKITTSFGKNYQVGNENVVADKYVEYPLNFVANEIGLLAVSADFNDIYDDLWQQAGFVLVAEAIKTFIVAFFIMFIVHWFITRHIYFITDYSLNLKGHNLDTPLTLPNRGSKKDELDDLADAINNMRLALKEDIIKLEEAENALISLNGELEIKVYDRTSLLASSNQQLQQSLDDLTLAKDKLVQSEKMASLGQLVAGVAHEVNTPLGICVTSITAIKEKIDQLSEAISSENLTKSQLSSTLVLLAEYQRIIERSLNKAVDLIRGFKSVAVEQHTDPEISINLLQHVNDVVNTVKTLFKQKKYTINISVDEHFNLITFPSAWNQILTNFLTNSHIHGFEGRQTGQIDIKFTHSKNFLTLKYSDDGKGLSKDIKKRIFDPFVTTKRGQGGSGLGMNIVFNLVHTKLGGTIKIEDTPVGCTFIVKAPIQHTNKPS